MDSKVLIGWASRDVSTDKPVGIRGQFHLRLSEGILDPVTVTALAISNDEDSVVFLSCDMVVVRSFLLRMIREKLRKINPQFPVEKIIMNATHTHEGGDLYDDNDTFETPPRMPGKEYQEFFSSMAAEAIVEAWEKRQPGGIAWGYGFATVAYSRRAVYFDDLSKRAQAKGNPGLMVNGHAAMYGNTNDPKFSHFEAGTETSLNVLFTYDANSKLNGILVNVPCPSQVSEQIWMLSADFWHETRQELRKKFGNEIQILPQCAASGDLSPHAMYYKAALQRRLELKGISERQDIAERIAEGVKEISSWASKDIRNSIRMGHISRTIGLNRRKITQAEYESELKNLEGLKELQPSTDPDPKQRMIADSILASRRNRCQAVIRRYKQQEKNSKLPMELHVLRLGDIAFASNRFELYMDYAHRIQARSPAVQTFIIQLAGSEVGEGGGTYLPTIRGEEGKGYSATQYCNLVDSSGGQELVEETLKSINELWK
ncbi:MAG: hypothetical protein A2X49_01720 [Lentisphaerae bacterium GWF2_52_8]|nr:MAG: hypothetical protein A2X49_01720 [Lentisphaerae bacterium GWF2_52_8]